MKVKRQKTVKRTLLFYKNYFDVMPPYNVVVDGTFCKAALKYKINIVEQLPKYLDAQVNMHTTRCCLAECEYFGAMLYGPLKVLQQYSVIACGHETPHAPVHCIRRLLKKSSEKLFVATQDTLLSEKTRKLAGTPLLYISHNAITLEAPSEASCLIADGKLKNVLLPSELELAKLVELKGLKSAGADEAPPLKKRRKKAKAPNPLSCKKKKTKAIVVISAEGTSSRSRRRRRQNKSKKQHSES